MKIFLRHLAHHGFKGAGVFTDAKWHYSYYRVNDSSRTIIVVSGLAQVSVSIFFLSSVQFKMFKENRLSVVPPGCICASGAAYVDDPHVVFVGNIRNKSGLEIILRKAEEHALKAPPIKHVTHRLPFR